MKIEIRADGAHISGYVNATEKKSRPVITPHGKVIEEIEPRAFERAIERAGNISLTVDHDASHVYAETQDGTLQDPPPPGAPLAKSKSPATTRPPK